MDKKITYSEDIKGIQRNKPSAFTKMNTFEELNMVSLESNGLYKLRKPISSVYNAVAETYTYVENANGLRPRGMAYVPSTVPAIIYWYGDKCFKVSPLDNLSDRIQFDKSLVTTVWTGKGDSDGNKYDWEIFIDGSDNDYLFCCGGNGLEWIKLSDFSTGTVGVVPTTNCNAVALNHRRLWVLSGDKMYYSAVNNGLSFDGSYLRLFENDNGYEMKVYDNVIFVFTDKKIYYVTGNDTDDFEVKVMEDTQCIEDCTFDVDSDGIYFMDKYANIRLIGSNPNYNAASRSQIISTNLNLYDKFISTDFKYPTSINVARNQNKIYVNVGVSADFSTSSGTIDATKASTTDFLTTSIWTNDDNFSITATDVYRNTMSILSAGSFSTDLVKNNMDLTFEVDVSTSKTETHIGIKDNKDMTTPNSGLYIKIDTSKNITFHTTDTSSTAIASGVADGTYYFRIKVSNYIVESKTGNIDFWYKTSNPNGTWGTATTTINSVDLDYTWYLGMFSTSSDTLNSQTLKNLFYINGGAIGETKLSDIYNLVFNLENKEWSEYALFSETIKQFPIEYMSPSKDRSLNSAQYLGCQWTTQVALYTNANNYMGVFNQKGSTKDNTKMYVLSNPFNIGTPNKKILRRFYADYYPQDAIVSLHLQGESDFGNDTTSILTIQSGWNKLPRTYRDRQFKWGFTTLEDTEFQFKQFGFEFDDLGHRAF